MRLNGSELATFNSLNTLNLLVNKFNDKTN